MSPLIKILFGCGLCLAGIQAMSTHQRASERAYSQPQVSNHPAKYNFQYAVKDDQSGNNFGHGEARDGAQTQGTYYVQLPDGRLQKVSYTVSGQGGYVAEVTYEQGSAPRPQSGPPSYGRGRK